MRIPFYFFLLFIVITIRGQVGINTKLPEATLDVVGKPSDSNHYDGIIPPRITGDQLSTKVYTSGKKGTIVFVTSPATNLVGQVKYVVETGLYCFDGSFWQLLLQDKDPIEYFILLTFDPTSTAGLTATSTWSTPRNQWGNTNAYLTSSKSYSVGTKNFGGLNGNISFKKNNGIVNIRFQLYRSDSEPITGNTFINIGDICNDLGFVPYQIALLHRENSTQYFPALLENYGFQIPQSTLSSMSPSFYTYGEVQSYSNWRKPYLK
ncbi:hypothetical protein H5J24_16195 [Chryseobacterium capnotolerans]|uniref:hypothetical protein n=1 Tax=Chryseobacterium TaxID=59732 RepID=UPI00083AD874|nr:MULTISPECIES: hypothetical protein [Chryseobacterium]UHO37273.1 hypothetical protein H5J24_16195 [Chryseobacterium capnotolerans]